ncbi:hypothetical protein [Ferrovum myxofaciens]|nr:hypothetical protein [Ferrovum myxofaciens]
MEPLFVSSLVQFATLPATLLAIILQDAAIQEILKKEVCHG